MENLCSDLYQYPPATVDSTVMYQMKWHQQWNYATVQIKQLDIQEDTLFFSRHVEKVWRWDGAKLSCIAAREKPNGRSIRALVKITHESICKLYSLIDHRLRWESTSTVHVVLFALKKVILLTSLQSGANKCRYQALPGAGVSHRCERADQSSWSLHRNENIWPEWKPAAVTPPPPRFSINAWQRGHL